MTKEITKAWILQQIEEKFGLRELIPEKFRFSEEVVPIYNISQHLLTPRSSYKERSVTGTGAILLTAADENEKRTFWRYDVVFMGAGAYTVAGIYVKRSATTDTVYLDLTAGQTVSYHVNLPQPVVLFPGDEIYVNIDGYTSTQNIRFYYDYESEEIR